MAPLRNLMTALAVVAVAAAPALAQDNQHSRRHRDGNQQQTQQAEQPRREQAQPSQEQAQPRRQDAQRREDSQARRDVQRREQVQPRQDVPRRNGNDQGTRGTAVPRVYPPDRGYSARPQYEVRRWDGGHYGEPLRYRYGYAPRIVHPTIIQVVPYRPYLYRPSWSIGLFYGADGYYPYGYTPDWYFHPIPGRYYGGVRITGAPRDARVFADGYFVGIVDDFDGIFQHLNLEAGPHHIEIQWGPYPPIAFDVNVRPGETITFRADAGYFERY